MKTKLLKTIRKRYAYLLKGDYPVVLDKRTQKDVPVNLYAQLSWNNKLIITMIDNIYGKGFWAMLRQKRESARRQRWHRQLYNVHLNQINNYGK